MHCTIRVFYNIDRLSLFFLTYNTCNTYATTKHDEYNAKIWYTMNFGWEAMFFAAAAHGMPNAPSGAFSFAHVQMQYLRRMQLFIQSTLIRPTLIFHVAPPDSDWGWDCGYNSQWESRAKILYTYKAKVFGYYVRALELQLQWPAAIKCCARVRAYMNYLFITGGLNNARKISKGDVHICTYNCTKCNTRSLFWTRNPCKSSLDYAFK